MNEETIVIGVLLVYGVILLVIIFGSIKLIHILQNSAQKRLLVSRSYLSSDIPSSPVSTNYNPWLSIWFQPKATIRQIVNTNPHHHTTLLAVVTGFYTVLDFYFRTGMNIAGTIGLLIGSLFPGAILGVIGLRLITALFYWMGNRLGGQASIDEVRAAIAWSTVPNFLLTLILIPAILINGGGAVNPDMVWFAVFMNLLGLILLIWMIVILVACLAEVNRFSTGNAIKTVAILAPIILLVLCIFFR
jgi:hypothetical protein